MIPLGWAPAGLKYRSKAALNSDPVLLFFLALLRSAFTYADIMSSTATLVLP
jgi:hypothetical protein